MDPIPQAITPEILAAIEAANTALSGIMPYRLAVVNPADVDLLEKNARFMRNDMFRQLVDNIRRDRGLQSVPLLYQPAGQRPKCVSGNHRIMAAKEAGLTAVLCLVIDEAKDGEEQIAIQLAHNAIAGEAKEGLNVKNTAVVLLELIRAGLRQLGSERPASENAETETAAA